LAPHPRNKSKWRDVETTQQRCSRLKAEKRWSKYQALKKRHKEAGMTYDEIDNVLFPVYGPGSYAVLHGIDAPAQCDGDVKGVVGREVLPSGIPFEDPKYWVEKRGNPKTSRLQDIEWVEEVKLLKGVKRDDAPSLTAWGHYRATVMTAKGEDRHNDLVKELLLPSKKEQARRAGEESEVELDKVFADWLRDVQEGEEAS